MANPLNNNGEQPPRTTGETMVVTFVYEATPSTSSMKDIPSSIHNRLILSPMSMQGQPVTPPSVGTGSFRPYVTGFTMPLNGREQLYGMPTSMIENLHNATSTFVDPLVNMFYPLQGSRPAVNNMSRINQTPGVGFSAQLRLNFTTNSTTVLRQQMDKSNHEMVHMLAQQMGTIFNLLI